MATTTELHCSNCQRTVGLLSTGRALPYMPDGKGGHRCADRTACKRARWRLEDEINRAARGAEEDT